MFTWHILFLNVWSSFVWSLFLITPKKYCMWIQTSWETNHEIPIMNLFLILMLKKPVFFNVKLQLLFFLFFLSRFFSFTNIHDSQDSRERGRVSIQLLFTTSTRFTDTETLAGWLLQSAESSPLHRARSRTRNRNLRFSSAGR